MNRSLARTWIALLPACALYASPCAGAKTITLSFEATVNSISRPWAPNEHIPPLPFAVELVDVIRGRIEFDPSVPMTGLDDAIQPTTISLEGFNWFLDTKKYTGYVLDDRRDDGTICDCGWSGPVSQDPLVFIGDQFASSSLPPLDDRIELTRFLGLGQDSETRVPEAPDWRWQPAITLAGSTEILHEDHLLPTSVEVWNAFSTKQLRIGIVGPYYDEAPGYDEWQVVGLEAFAAEATISTFVVIPEPSSALLLALALVGAMRVCNLHLKLQQHVAPV